MANYIGGPLDGRSIVTAYDRLPVILFPWPDSRVQEPESVLRYELARDGSRRYIGSTDYPRPGIATNPTQEADK